MSWTFISETRPKARKNHNCHFCGLPIRSGTKHIARTGVGDGGFETIKMHSSCVLITQDWDFMDWDCFVPGDLDLDQCDPVTVETASTP